jgi:hypothetical protein
MQLIHYHTPRTCAFYFVGLIKHLKTTEGHEINSYLFESIKVEHALRTQHKKVETQYSAFSYEVKIKHGTS